MHIRQLLFSFSLLALCWLTMMAVHEFGHVLGAVATGGSIERVVLHPLTISRTDVSPNPRPAFVVWMGPTIGCALPMFIVAIVPTRRGALRNVSKFFAGFCLVANGAYVAVGSFDGVGDCGIMLATGAPRWTLLLFGASSVSLGLFAWHRMGSLGQFLSQPSLVTARLAYTTTAAVSLLIAIELFMSQ